MHKDISREVLITVAMFGLIVSSLIATAGVAALGVQAQVALAQVVPGTINVAQVAAAQSSSLTEAQIQAVLGLLAAFNVDQTTINNVQSILEGSTPVVAPSTQTCSNGLNYSSYSSCSCPTGQTQNGTSCVTPATTPTAASFSLNERVQTIANANIRSTPSITGSIITQLSGALGTVVGGPVTTSDGHTWLRVNFDNGTSGWTVQGNLQAATATTGTCPSGTAGTPPNCTNTSTNAATLSATPTSGTEPLAVQFQTSAQSGTINFGDGASASVSQLTCTNGWYIVGSCSDGASHTYTSAGTYTATLTSNGTTIGTVTITVGGSTNVIPSISSISLSSGPVGTQITINGSNFTGNNSAPLTVDFGGYDTFSVPSTGNGTSISFTIPASEFTCDAHRSQPAALGSDCAGTIINVQPGTYQMYVWNGNGTSNSASFTVTGALPTPVLQFNAFPDSSHAQRDVDFNISVSPPTSIGSAQCPDETANYTMDFGDGTTAPVNFTSGCAVQIQTPTHTYSSAGPYTANLLSGSTVLETVTISDSWASQFNGSSW